MSEPVDRPSNTGDTNKHSPERRELLSDVVRERNRIALEGTNKQTPEQIEAQTPRENATGDNAATGPLASAPSLAPGIPARIGRYDIRKLLGQGQYGRVYLAHDSTLNRFVAIKTPFGIRSEKDRERFLREAESVAVIHHRNVCPVYDAGLDGETLYIVMRYVKGGTLEDLLKRQPPTPSEALRIAGKIAQGLNATHREGVTHRDLKPANVLYDKAMRELLIADFGFARIGLDASLSLPGAGTPLYMSPEQARQLVDEIGPCSDVYSLGVILYEMLTGRVPFTGDSPFDVMAKHVKDLPPPLTSIRPNLNQPVESLCLKALEKKPANRYASAKDVAGSIAEYLRQPAPVSLPVVVPPPRTPEVELPLPGGLTMAFCWIPKGECQLGSPQTEKKRQADEDEERRGKFVTEGFWMGKYPVTQAEWRAITGDSPSYFQVGKGGADEVEGLDTTQFPVESVSWDMICGKDGKCGQDTFLGRLNALGGVAKIFGKGAGKFSLPHEDQWEYACRGGLGNRQPFYFGTELNGLQANIDGNHPFGTSVKGPYKERPTPGGFYTAKALLHPWGLFDMHGNVWEWCENGYDRASVSRVLRGGSWLDFALTRVVRGGSFHDYALNSRAAGRAGYAPGDVHCNFGCRLVLSLDL